MSESHTTSTNHNVLVIQCSDAMGLIYNISNILYNQQLNIVSNAEFVDDQTRQFFFRAVLEGEVDSYLLIESLKKILPQNAEISLVARRKKRIVVLATKEHHCLGDILIKNYFGDFNAEIQAVVSNHEVLKDLVQKYEIPFHYVSHKGLDREEHETLVRKQIDQYDSDFLVLAKYMRILTPDFVAAYNNRIINIHHSFLPAFIGANPYRQAFNRGVKIIGATAHFVNNDLDEGPIIHQDIGRVNHTYDAKSMSKAGKEIEKAVLNRALKLVFDDRVLINGNKTIVF